MKTNCDLCFILLRLEGRKNILKHFSLNLIPTLFDGNSKWSWRHDLRIVRDWCTNKCRHAINNILDKAVCQWIICLLVLILILALQLFTLVWFCFNFVVNQFLLFFFYNLIIIITDINIIKKWNSNSTSNQFYLKIYNFVMIVISDSMHSGMEQYP